MNVRPVTEDDLHALVDGQLSAARQTQVETWLASHPEAARRVDDYRRLRDDLRDAFADVLDEPAPARLNIRNLYAGRSWFSPKLQNAAAAAIMLMIGGVLGWSLHGWSPPQRRGIEALAQEAAASYAVYAPDDTRPIEIPASDRHVLDRWVSKRIGRDVQAPDLTGSGLRLLGGRLVATPHGPAAMFLYQNAAGSRVAMLVRPMEVDKTAAMRRHREDQTEGYAWAQDGLGYSLVSTAGTQNLAVISLEARRRLNGART